MSASVLERVIKVTCEKLGVNEAEVNESSSFENDLNADSLDVVELVMGFEEEFGIEIPDDDVPTLKTVGQAAQYIENKV